MFTVIVVALLSSGLSSAGATPKSHAEFGEVVSHTPPMLFCRRSAVIVRALVALSVSVSVPSRAPSGVRAVSRAPTRSRSLPLYARSSVTAGSTVKPLVSVATAPGTVTLTLRAPSAAPLAIANRAVIRVGESTATLLTVIPEPALTVAPLTKPVPSIVAVTVVPVLPRSGVTAVTVSVGGTSWSSARSTRMRGRVTGVPLRVSVTGTPVDCSEPRS